MNLDFIFFKFILLLLLCCFTSSDAVAQKLEYKRFSKFKPWEYKLASEDDSKYRSIYNRKEPLLPYFEKDSVLHELYLDYLVLNDFKRAANIGLGLFVVTPFFIANAALNSNVSNNFFIVAGAITALSSLCVLMAPIIAIIQNYKFKSVMRRYNEQYTKSKDIEIEWLIAPALINESTVGLGFSLKF